MNPLTPYQGRSLIVGGAGLLLAALGWIINAEQFYRAYLYAWLFFLGLSLGSMGIVMMHWLVGGGWGLLIRRPGEAAAKTLPLLIVLFIPIAIGVHRLYPWADANEISADAVIRHRHVFFNPSWYLLRAAIYFAIWLLMIWRLSSLSLAQDAGRAAGTEHKLMRLSSAGLVIYFVTMSLAAVDWVMSREPHWYSTILGFIVIIAQGLAALVFLIVMLVPLSREAHVRGVIRRGFLNDLGNLLLTMIILWAYLSFAQLLVQWMGNTQEDVTWYVHRSRGGWRFLVIALIALHFFVPFLLLLFQDVKRDLRLLARLAAGILFLHLLFVLWMIEPSGRGARPHGISWIDFVTPVGVGGIWFAAFIRLLGRHPLLPVGEPFPPTDTDGEHETVRPTPTPAA